MTRSFAALAATLFFNAFALAADKMAFEIYADKAEETRWRLKDGDAAVVVSQGYAKKADAAKMVENLKTKIDDYKFVVEEDKKKEFRFNITAKNGQTVGSSSKGYKTKADAEKVIEAIKAGAKDATVKDETKK